jgi:hypothetical protein
MVVFLRIFLKSFHTKLRFFFKLSEVQGGNKRFLGIFTEILFPYVFVGYRLPICLR